MSHNAESCLSSATCKPIPCSAEMPGPISPAVLLWMPECLRQNAHALAQCEEATQSKLMIAPLDHGLCMCLRQALQKGRLPTLCRHPNRVRMGTCATSGRMFQGALRSAPGARPFCLGCNPD